MVSDTLKSLEYYRENKKKFNKKYNFKWKQIAGPDYLGSCSYLFQEFYKEWKTYHPNELPSCNDFGRYYFSHTNPDNKPNEIKHPESVKYGRSLNELIVLARHYKDICGDNTISFEEYFDDVVNHAIVETFDGQMREVRLKEKYEQYGFIVDHLNGKWDKDYGVDSVIRNKNGFILEYIQCKPITTFLGKYNKSLVEDRKMFFLKEKEKKKECKRLDYPYYPTRFILYNEEYPDKWCGLDGKKSFLLEELCDNDGMPLHEKEDFEYFD